MTHNEAMAKALMDLALTGEAVMVPASEVARLESELAYARAREKKLVEALEFINNNVGHTPRCETPSEQALCMVFCKEANVARQALKAWGSEGE